jgi:hypothetical protein
MIWQLFKKKEAEGSHSMMLALNAAMGTLVRGSHANYTKIVSSEEPALLLVYVQKRSVSPKIKKSPVTFNKTHHRHHRQLLIFKLSLPWAPSHIGHQRRYLFYPCAMRVRSLR